MRLGGFAGRLRGLTEHRLWLVLIASCTNSCTHVLRGCADGACGSTDCGLRILTGGTGACVIDKICEF